jgi:hypothetical protein
MIQFIRKTGPKNHTHEAKRRSTHTRSTRQAHALPNHRPRRHKIRTHDIETASQLKQQLEANPNSRRHTSTYSPPRESASELQDQTRPEDSVIQEVSTAVYIAPKTPMLQVAAALSPKADMGLHEQLEQRLQEGNDARAPPLPDQHGLGFPPLLRRGRMKGSRQRLQEGDDTRRRRRRPAIAPGFLPTLPSAPQSARRHPGCNLATI